MNKKARKLLVANIHECEDVGTGSHWAVCHWDANGNNWVQPLDTHDRRLTGCLAEVARCKEYFADFTRKEAYSRARVLYGYAKRQKKL